MNSNLTQKILSGDVRTAARLMRGIEDDSPAAIKELRNLYAYTGKSYIVGMTGAPGVGKSTLLNALIAIFRRRKLTVGVVAVDPTSPYSGGALLGDRIRMAGHALDKGVFIRSLATRGWSGGLARATMSIIHVLDAMGKDIILVEAVGSGQGEIDISRLADTTVVVLSPGAGDEIQIMKAGILETADIFVINKSDIEGAKNLKAQLEQIVDLVPKSNNEWKIPIIFTAATKGTGVEQLTKAILEHKKCQISTGQIKQRRKERAKLELAEAVMHSLRSRTDQILKHNEAQGLTDKLVNKQIDPYSVADKIMARSIPQKAARKK